MVYVKKWLEYYEELFPLADGQCVFFEKLTEGCSAPVKFLNIDCGPALICDQLLQKNFDVTATDTYPEFIDFIKTKYTNKEPKIHAFNLLPQDIARYLGKSFFNLIYCGNYRLIFLHDKITIHKLLMDAKYLLADGGYLVFDLLNFSKYDFSNDKIELPTLKSNRITLHSSITKDKEAVSYILNQHVITESGKTIDEVKNETISPIGYESFKLFAKDLGFSSIEFFSDFKMTPFNPDSTSLICVLKK